MTQTVATQPSFAAIKGFSRAFSITDVFLLAKQRRALRKLDDHILSDIGIDKTAADLEASRPIWDVPNNWRA